jgi:hypothetical protein
LRSDAITAIGILRLLPTLAGDVWELGSVVRLMSTSITWSSGDWLRAPRCASEPDFGPKGQTSRNVQIKNRIRRNIVNRLAIKLILGCGGDWFLVACEFVIVLVVVVVVVSDGLAAVLDWD